MHIAAPTSTPLAPPIEWLYTVAAPGCVTQQATVVYAYPVLSADIDRLELRILALRLRCDDNVSVIVQRSEIAYVRHTTGTGAPVAFVRSLHRLLDEVEHLVRLGYGETTWTVTSASDIQHTATIARLRASLDDDPAVVAAQAAAIYGQPGDTVRLEATSKAYIAHVHRARPLTGGADA